ncbi:tetratricopeptide repeat protein [Tenacibaculum aiptasiae]|uniref:Tetratricopeptide repeat protein n=2 Tax=Tenacibaculum aiptasiae TaxID=426481 RepID=A0A7J5AMA1_9FLAO|nr:tetratricopeptide repeat protein [Tenacibaculum aiptasiae]
MILKKVPYIMLLLISISVVSQNMKEGFTYLETGKYKQAETFFKEILEDYPTNKTARLCYGRAVGLNGDAKKAKNIFINLLKDYENDFEVKLNYAESLLWDKSFSDAKSYYKKLIDEDSKSFSALLGYANTLSNLKEYEDAIVYINKALEVSPGNPNALTSKKFIYLGYAYQQQQLQDYPKAESILKKNLTFFNNDQQTLFNLANLYLIANELDKAEEIYTLLEKKEESKLAALNGLALVSHLNGKEPDALNTSKKAYDLLSDSSSPTIIQQTKERYVQALIWNKKFKDAESLINNLVKEYPNENWVLSLRATLNIYRSDFKKSVADYNLILENDSSSFDGNLGKANALKALGNYDNAYKSAENTLVFYKNQKDASNFIKKLDESFTPFIDNKASYSFDNGDNEAYSYTAKIEFPLSTRFKVLGNYNFRTTKNTVSNIKATSNNFLVGISYDLLGNLNFSGSVGITSSKAETKSFNQILSDVSFNYKPFKLQNLKVGYKREIQNFNAELINREIVLNNFYANYSLNTNFNVGLFSQYFYTTQSDDNARNLLFASLYYNIMNKPSIKAGFNFQNISFKNQVPAIYFSPSKFNAYEVFVNIIRNEVAIKSEEWFYELTAATGFQFIENDAKQSTYRVQAKLGYKISDRSLVNIFASQSNIASATASGFRFTEIGVRFKWLLLKKPIFKKKEQKN